MQSYSTSKGRVPFNWNKFLNKTEFTESELHYASKNASSWVTCACGNQCDIIPRNSSGSPKDPKLTSLGLQFATHIGRIETTTYIARELNIQLAKGVLLEIEIRSAQLIQEITNGTEERTE